MRRVLTLLALCGLACGSRSGLLSADGGAPGAGGAASGGAPSGGSGGVGATGGVGGVGGAPPVPDCVYQLHGEPIQLVTYVEGVHSPLMAAITSGAPGKPARVGYAATHEHFWHPEIRVAELSVGTAWPDGVALTKNMVLYGVDAHAPGVLLRQSGAAEGLALAWFHGDLASASVVPGVKFRRLETQSWQPAGDVFIEEKSGYVYAFVAGPAVDGAGAYAGDGYLVAWRSSLAAANVVQPRVALLDAQGKIIRGPVAAEAPLPYPGAGIGATWSGAHYLVGANDGCSDPAVCQSRITVSRLTVGKTNDLTGLVEASGVDANLGMIPRSPILGASPQRSFIVWREIDPNDSEAMHVVRGLALNPEGQLTGEGWAQPSRTVGGPYVHGSDQGIAVLWGERGEDDGPEDQPGHSHLVLRQHTKSGQFMQQILLPTTAMSYATPYSAVTLETPHALLVSWSGKPVGANGPDVTYLARFDCDPN